MTISWRTHPSRTKIYFNFLFLIYLLYVSRNKREIETIVGKKFSYQPYPMFGRFSLAKILACYISFWLKTNLEVSLPTLVQKWVENCLHSQKFIVNRIFIDKQERRHLVFPLFTNEHPWEQCEIYDRSKVDIWKQNSYLFFAGREAEE